MNGRLHLRARRWIDRPAYFEAVEHLRHQFVLNAGKILNLQVADTLFQDSTSD